MDEVNPSTTPDEVVNGMTPDSLEALPDELEAALNKFENSDNTTAAVSTPATQAVPEPVTEAEKAVEVQSPAMTTVAPVVDQAISQVQQPANHQAMAQVLSTAIEEGKRQVPNPPADLVSKPSQLESWRVFKIMSEFVEGFDLIGKYTVAATFFGSVRTTPDLKIYQEASDLAARLAKNGIAVITGGSAGIMEAGNKGAFEAGGASIGLNIRLADNQQMNKFTTESITFDHFFVRKVMLTFSSEVYVYFPGGYGTLDEFTEILTLVQTKKIKSVPIVLYGKEFWAPIIDLFRYHLLDRYKTIDENDLNLFHIVDSVDEAFDFIQKTVKPR